MQARCGAYGLDRRCMFLDGHGVLGRLVHTAADIGRQELASPQWSAAPSELSRGVPEHWRGRRSGQQWTTGNASVKSRRLKQRGLFLLRAVRGRGGTLT